MSYRLELVLIHTRESKIYEHCVGYKTEGGFLHIQNRADKVTIFPSNIIASVIVTEEDYFDHGN